MVALLRLVELRVGRITIDGVDIASVPLHVRTHSL
jgi:ABC-type multidrug transport system fused ATPase/permease subunit